MFDPGASPWFRLGGVASGGGINEFPTWSITPGVSELPIQPDMDVGYFWGFRHCKKKRMIAWKSLEMDH